ncbi:unnamed protein product [Linum trigynum]|uniref:Reverse transcriptase zinc-binding domain-containing protein n=1 Tax=Linum trigynum TaxID=586398 RepID=A0AAV2G7M4_9ROSI
MPIMKSATVWSVRNGNTTAFWSHPWTDYDVLLSDFLIVDESLVDLNSPVSCWVTPSGGWDWEKLFCLIHPDGLSLLAGMEPPKPDLGEDTSIWGIERDGSFSFKLAYYLVNEDLESEADSSWKLFWKWRGPNRIKLFLWLARHERLMTNVKRAKMKIPPSNNCGHCLVNEETT